MVRIFSGHCAAAAIKQTLNTRHVRKILAAVFLTGIALVALEESLQLTGTHESWTGRVKSSR